MLAKVKLLNPRQKYTWALEAQGFVFAHFSKCTSPGMEVEVTKFNSAGTLHSINRPGRVNFNMVEAEKMMIQEGADVAAYIWINLAANVNTGLAAPPAAYLRDVDLIHYNRMGIPIDRWTLHNAWLQKLGMDDMEAGSSDALMEKLAICYDYYTRLL